MCNMKLTVIVILIVLRQCICQQDCQEEVKIKNCKDGKLPRPWGKRQTHLLSAVFVDKCKRPGRIEYDWYLYRNQGSGPKGLFTDERIDTKRTTLMIKPFILTKGQYEIAVYALPAGSKEPLAMSTLCAVEVLGEDPIPVLTGGNERTVKSKTKFLMDGRKSRSMDDPSAKGQFQFRWTCTVEKGEDKSFCAKPMPPIKTIMVPKQYAKPGYVYKFTLSVKNSDSGWVSTTQVINVKNNVVVVKIVCNKNCVPHVQYTDVNDVTFFEALCLGGSDACAEQGVQKFYWTLEGQQLNYAKDTEFGQNKPKFVIKKNVLQPGKKYKVHVEVTGLAGKTGSAVHEFETKKPPSVQSCTPNPKSGIASETTFTVTCQDGGNGVTFEIYTAEKGSAQKVLLTTAADLNELKFKLPADNDVFIIIKDDHGFSTELKLDVTVTSASGPDAENAQKNDVDRLVDTKNYDEAAQVIANVLFETKKEPNQQDPLVKEKKEWIIDKLNEFPLDSPDQVKQIGSIMAVMSDGDEKNPDPDMAEKMSEMCKKLAQKHLELSMENAAYIKSSDAQQITKDLMSCAEANTQENPELLRPETAVHVETPFPPLPEAVIPENYPDYEDDEKVGRNTEKLDIATKNAVDICILNGKSISVTSSTGEGAVGASSKFCEVSVTKNTGDEMTRTILTAKGITVTPSSDFGNIAGDITSTICIWSKNPFWWTNRDVQLNTNVALVQFSDENHTDYTTFQNPVTVSLDVTGTTVEAKIHDVEFPTPGRYASEEDLSVIRIDVRKGESYFVRFDLDDLQTFRMVISDFYKPTFEEVQRKGELINKASSFFYREHSHNYSGWHYISMLPENEETKNQSQYRVSVYTISCYTWNVETRGWSFGCKGTVKSDTKRLECECSHLSVLAGMFYDNNIQIEKTTKFQYIMVLLVNYSILIRTSTVFLVYCFLILFIRRKKREVIYVLPDVSRFARYLYVVVVETGSKSKSSTTSNVCIKLHGTRGASKEHVLNYPDPQGRMLNSGHLDFFALTNEFHLGNLTKIDLWFDCIGQRSSWYCESVMIYDCQTKENWYFEVHHWLSLHPHNVAYVSTELENKEHVYVEGDAGKRQACVRKCKKLAHDLCSKKLESDRDTPSSFAKITIMLSVFVTIYGLIMVMYGMPVMRLKDGFTTYHTKFHWTLIVIPTGSAFITFGMHVTLISLWKLPTPNKVLLWSILTVNVIFWMSLLVLFGFWLPAPKMWLWLIASILSLVVYYLILYNIYANIRRVGRTAKTMAIEILNKTNNLIEIVDSQRRFLFKQFGGNVLRPYLTHLYRPLNEEEIKYKKRREVAKMEVFDLVIDVAMFLVYIALLYLVILANKDSLTIISYHKMLELLRGQFTRTKGFNKIKSIETTYNYLNQTLIWATQSLQWYGKFVVDDPGTMKDFDNKYMGVVRLRQHRVTKHSCQTPSYMVQSSSQCVPSFFSWTKDVKPFGVGINQHERLASAWNYTDWNKAGTFLAFGTMAVYPGGGYVAPLGRTMTNSIINLNYLRRKEWINPTTRAVFVEFITYNANANLFNAIQILVEYSPTGYVQVTNAIKTARLLFVKNETDYVKLAIFGSFIAILAVFAFRLIQKVWHNRKIFFRDLWLIIDSTIVILSASCFGLFMYRATLVGHFLQAIEGAKKNEFVNYFTLFRWEGVLTIFAAFLVCIATIRLWKLLRFGTIFLVVEKTILLSARPFFALLLYQIVIFLAFALTAHVTFGSNSSVFKDYPSAIVGLVLLSLNLGHHIGMANFTQHHQYSGSFFYGVFMFTTMFINTIYIVIICLNYKEAQTLYSNSKTLIKTHLLREMLYLKNWLLMKVERLRGGDERDEPQRVTPKSEEHRYADCLSTTKKKLELMTFVIRNLLEGQQMTDEQKIEVMLYTASKYMEKDLEDKEIFFKTQNEHKKFKLLHDNKMVEIAKTVEGLLGKTFAREQYAAYQYKRTMNRHMRKLNHIEEVLKLASKVIDNIKLEE